LELATGRRILFTVRRVLLILMIAVLPLRALAGD
jgi:hypothetical protein